MTAKMNMKSWYTMRMLKTFFSDVTTQSKTACREDRRGAKVSEEWYKKIKSESRSERYLEFRKPLDGFKRPQNSENSERLDCFDVSTFVIPANIKTQQSVRLLHVQSNSQNRHHRPKTVRNNKIIYMKTRKTGTVQGPSGVTKVVRIQYFLLKKRRKCADLSLKLD